MYSLDIEIPELETAKRLALDLLTSLCQSQDEAMRYYEHMTTIIMLSYIAGKEKSNIEEVNAWRVIGD
jgi:hypothetical protein